MSGKIVKTIDDIGLTEEQLNALFFLFDQETPSAFQTPRKKDPMWVPSAPLREPNPKCFILTSQGLSQNGEVLTMAVSSENPRILSGECRHDIINDDSNDNKTDDTGYLWDRDGFNSEPVSDVNSSF